MLDRVEPPLPVQQQIDLAVRNLIPRMHLRLSDTDFRTWGELERVATRYEKSYNAVKEYTPPPTPDKTHFPGSAYPDEGRTARRHIRAPATTLAQLNYEDELDKLIAETYLGIDESVELNNVTTPPSRGRSKDRQVRFENRSRELKNRSPTPAASSDKSPVRQRAEGRCYRCGDKNHFINDCQNPRRVFCHGCGTRGIYRYECTQCPPITKEGHCKKCGLVGATSENCPECSGNH